MLFNLFEVDKQEAYEAAIDFVIKIYKKWEWELDQ